ncbi:hypothetical protein G3I42_15835, partial [Streptomyces sp. SID11385]|nr:hypothetical protein [Streptomyces sp. SID11385]
MPPRPTRSRTPRSRAPRSRVLGALALTLTLFGTGAGLQSAYAAQPARAEAPPADA